MRGCRSKVAAERRGVFKRIPFCYSEDLYLLVKSMLKVKPEERIHCEEIINVCRNKRLTVYKDIEFEGET